MYFVIFSAFKNISGENEIFLIDITLTVWFNYADDYFSTLCRETRNYFSWLDWDFNEINKKYNRS